MASVINMESVYEKVKKARLQRLVNNCYSMETIEHCQKFWSKGDEFVFSYEDHGIQRLIFFVKDMCEVDKLLSEIESGRYYLEFMTKDPNVYIPSKSKKCAAMMRFANSDCRSVFEPESQVIRFKNAVPVENANEQDIEEINSILWTTFHTEISHLLTDDELRGKIRDGQFTIHRNTNNRIDALLQADVMPKKFYINQVVNRGNKEVIHAILMNRLEKYVNDNGKYLYAWVEDNNIASIKFHEKYGLRHDGMWSMIYCIER